MSTLIQFRRTVDILKPLRDDKGEMEYADALAYLVKITPQHHPNFIILLRLASFATNPNGLSEKQRELADKFIWRHEELNTDVFRLPNKKSRRL